MTTTTTTTTAVVFSVGPDRYAVAAAAVREAICKARVFALPTAPPALLGAFNLRGEVLPVFDTGMLLGVGAIADGSTVMVVNTSAGPAGFAVSDLPRVAILTNKLGPSELRGTLGVFGVDDQVAVLVDVEELLVPHAALNTSPASEDSDHRGEHR